MTRHRPYRPFSTCPHTYGVRPRPCSAIATEPCRPTACAGEHPHLTAFPPPFRHTPGQSRPRHTATVWRNPRQHPHRDGTFTFSAKERDSETGLSYFGSRYYSSDLSIWLSVDPMSDKYPSLSPYVYCANNPVMLVDPNGEEIYVEIDGIKYRYNGNGLEGKDGCEFVPKANSFEGRVLKDLNSLKNSKSSIIRNKMNDLIKSKHSHSIKLSSDGDDYNEALDNNNISIPGKGSGTITHYNPFSKKNNCVDGDRLSCAVLTHELLGHGWNKDKGMYEADRQTNNGVRYEEINAINLQNIVLKEHNLQPRTAIGRNGEPGIPIPESELDHYFTPKPQKNE